MFLELPLRITFGWIGFVYDNYSRIEIRPAALATALAAVIGTTIGLHFTLRWLVVARDSSTNKLRRWPVMGTIRATALLALLFLAATCFVGVVHQSAWLVTAKQPFFQAGRPLALRMQSKNNLKQIGLGFLNYHDKFRSFPIGGGFDRIGQPRHGWATLILPMIEERKLYESIDLSKTWDDRLNREAFAKVVPCYSRPPSPELESNANGYALNHYSGNRWLFPMDGTMTIKSIRDGTSKTILAGEVTEGLLPWGHPLNFRDPAAGLKLGPRSFGGPTDRVTQFLMADGSINSMTDDTDPAVLRAFATPAEGD